MLEEMPPELSLERNEGWIEAGRFLDKQGVVLARLSYVGNYREVQPESRGGIPRIQSERQIWRHKWVMEGPCAMPRILCSVKQKTRRNCGHI